MLADLLVEGVHAVPFLTLDGLLLGLGVGLHGLGPDAGVGDGAGLDGDDAGHAAWAVLTTAFSSDGLLLGVDLDFGVDGQVELHRLDDLKTAVEHGGPGLDADDFA